MGLSVHCPPLTNFRSYLGKKWNTNCKIESTFGTNQVQLIRFSTKNVKRGQWNVPKWMKMFPYGFRFLDVKIHTCTYSFTDAKIGTRTYEFLQIFLKNPYMYRLIFGPKIRYTQIQIFTDFSQKSVQHVWITYVWEYLWMFVYLFTYVTLVRNFRA